MIYAILMGTLVGFLAGRLIRGEGYGFWKNLGLGLVGGFVGKLLLGLIGLVSYGLVGDLVAGTIGAVLLVLVFGRSRVRGMR